jgi:hypothetical protein
MKKWKKTHVTSLTVTAQHHKSFTISTEINKWQILPQVQTVAMVIDSLSRRVTDAYMTLTQKIREKFQDCQIHRHLHL